MSEVAVGAGGSDERLNDFARASGVWFWETDAEHRYSWFSAASELQDGVSHLGALGRTRMEVAQQAGADLAAEPWLTHLQALQRREPFLDFVCHYPNASGGYWLSVSGVPRFDAERGFLGYRAATRNITQQVELELRHRAEQSAVQARLQQSEDSYRTLVELSPEPIAVHRQGRLIYVNRAAVRLMQAESADELLGKSLFELLVPEHHAFLKAQAGEPRAQGTAPQSNEITCLTLAGSAVDLVAKSIPIRWNGELAILVITHDITARQRERRRQQRHSDQLFERLNSSESSLLETEKRLALAADAANLGFWVRDLRRDEVWASERWRMLFGFAPTQRIDSAAILQQVHPSDRNQVLDTLQRAMQGAGRFETEHRIHLAPGELRWVSSVGRFEFDSQGEPVALRGATVEITARKQAEREMRQRQREVAHLSRVTMLGELSGSLAHELNQPLTAILSNAQAAQRFLEKDPVDLDELREIMQDIVAEDKRAGEVIRRLRLLLSTGEQQHQAVDINEVLADVFKLLRSDMVNHGTLLDAQLAPDLPAVNADGVQLQQVMINLMMNACDAMRGVEAPRRQIQVRSALQPGEGVRVSVVDQGCGLGTVDPEQVFAAFYTTKAQGMGLGLSISRSIVAAAGGRLWAENNVGPGATFHFSLPSLAGGKT